MKPLPSHGMLSAQTLTPLQMALGNNRYLGREDFLQMLFAALAVHMAIFAIASLFPSEKVQHIPVRTLSFKLGDEDKVAAYGAPATPVNAAMPASPVMQASTADVAKISTPVVPVVKPKPKPVTPVVQTKPTLEEPPPAVLKKPEPEPSPPPVVPAPQQAIAPTPQQYVREEQRPLMPSFAVPGGVRDGAVGGSGTENTMTAQTAEAIRDRYEQQISGWIEQHKVYPMEAGGRAGRTVIRMRIDRMGIVRYYALEQSSLIPAMDAAALDMIRRANPLPAAPVNYPAGNLIEFLIPISFKAPQ